MQLALAGGNARAVLSEGADEISKSLLPVACQCLRQGWCVMRLQRLTGPLLR